MKKGVIITTASSLLTIVLSLLFIYMLLTSASQKTENYATATRIVSKYYVFNKIVASRNCISTGETGVLEKELLDLADGGDELECARLPDISHYVKVDNLTNGEGWDWGFGYVGSWETVIKSYVSIKDGNTISPGMISVSFNSVDPGVITDKDDELVCLTGAAERAWKLGEREKTCSVEFPESRTIHFNVDEICLIDQKDNVMRCRKLGDGVIVVDETCLRRLTDRYCTVKFVKDEAVPELLVEECKCSTYK